MKITQHARAAFLNALTLAADVASNSRYNEARQHLQLKCEAGQLYVSASDGDTTTTYTAPANCENRFETCETFTAPAKMIAKLVKMLPDGDLTLQTHATPHTPAIRVTTGHSTYTLVTIDADEMQIDAPTGEVAASATMPAKTLRDLLIGVLPFVSSDDTRGPLCGALLVIQENRLRACATNTHVIRAMDAEPYMAADQPYIVTHGSAEAILPTPALKSWIATLKTQSDETPVTIDFREDSATLSADGAQISSAILDGSFPPYEKVLNLNCIGYATVDRKELAKAVEGTLKFKGSYGDPKVELEFDGDNLTVNSYSDENGNTRTEVPAHVDARAFDTLPLNAKYLFTALKATTPAKAPKIKGQKAPADIVTIEFCVASSGERMARIDGVVMAGMIGNNETADNYKTYKDQAPAAIAAPTPAPEAPTPDASEPEAESVLYRVEWQRRDGDTWFGTGDTYTEYADATRCAEIEAMNDTKIQSRVREIRADEIPIGESLDRAMPDVEADAAPYTFMLMWNEMPHYTAYATEAEAIAQHDLYSKHECHVTAHHSAKEPEADEEISWPILDAALAADEERAKAEREAANADAQRATEAARDAAMEANHAAAHARDAESACHTAEEEAKDAARRAAELHAIAMSLREEHNEAQAQAEAAAIAEAEAQAAEVEAYERAEEADALYRKALFAWTEPTPVLNKIQADYIAEHGRHAWNELHEQQPATTHDQPFEVVIQSDDGEVIQPAAAPEMCAIIIRHEARKGHRAFARSTNSLRTIQRARLRENTAIPAKQLAQPPPVSLLP